MRGFWNDPDGISISDFLALLFSTSYLGLLGLIIARMRCGALTATDVDFLQVVTWPTLTILGGYFGGQMLSRLQGSLSRSPGPVTGYGSEYGYGYQGPLYMADPRLPVQSGFPGVETVDELSPEQMEDARRG